MANDTDEYLRQVYADKETKYYHGQRSEMFQYIPQRVNRLLDVGCGAGTFGAGAKERLGCEVWGVEPDDVSATKAKACLNHVVHGLFSEEAKLPEGSFDCIVFNDVLEHMFAPEEALRYAKRLLTPGGSIVSSIPNIGHFPTIWRLVFRGEWEYGDCGPLDRTHLRFFTRKSVRELFEKTGYRLEALDGINDYAKLRADEKRLWRYYKPLSYLPINSLKDMRYLQFGLRAVVA